MVRLAAVLAVLSAVSSCGPDLTPLSGGGPGFTSGPAPKQQQQQQHALQITGGTVQIAGAGQFAAVVDADLARVWIVDLGRWAISSTVDLPPGSAPGRMAVDADGYLYVALRSLGEVAKISVPGGEVVSTRAVCGDPRGLTWDPKVRVMRIACADGSLVSLPPQGHATSVRVAADLRDVLLTPDGLAVTTFRAAQVVLPDPVTPSGPPLVTRALPQASVTATDPVPMVPQVAWRAVMSPDGTVVVVHEREVDGPVENLHAGVAAAPMGPTTMTMGAYSTGPVACQTPVVRSALAVLPPMGSTASPRFVEVPGVLPVDVAVSPDAKEAAVALAGSNFVERVQLSGGNSLSLCAPTPSAQAVTAPSPDGVGYTPDGRLVIHARNPSQIILASGGSVKALVLDASPLQDDGQRFFHAPMNGIACASCHPEGRDDGHVWNVAGQVRRTPSLAGGLLETAPFHWQGELVDMQAVVGETFVHRMGGLMPDGTTVDALGSWLESVPRPAPTRTMPPKLYAQAKALFESPAVGCTSCHLGAALTSGATLSVNTGDAFQVPSLRGVGARAPYLHDGRAPTLRDRFAPMGGGDFHGHTSQLTDHELELLVAYLETL